ncbi:MAG TPA: hypothetical protein VII73_13605 [Caulobacteraceae bacterium]
MTRSLAALIAAVWLCGCSGSYGLGDGDANYDAVKAASAQCKAQGGEIRLSPERDGRDLSDYQCKIGKGR